MTITKNSTLAEIVSNDFRTAVVFNKHNLDFCCNGKKTIEEACNKKGIDSKIILEEITRAANNGENNLHFNNWSADFLIEYIVNNHHAYCREMIPVILKHAGKASKVHGEKRPEFTGIYNIFCEVAEEMNAHMDKEEKMLFPYIKKIASDMNEHNAPPFGSVGNPITVMENEHKDAGDALAKIKELSSNYAVQSDFCETCRVLYKELEEFEKDLHMHVHLENNILFPMAIKLEEEKNVSEGDSCCML